MHSKDGAAGSSQPCSNQPCSNQPCSILPCSILRNFLASLAVLATVAAGLPAVAHAGDADWKVHGRLMGKDGRKSEDVSGIACTRSSGFPRSCLVIDDNMQSAQLVVVNDGDIDTDGVLVKLIDNQRNGKPLELDGEGVAYAGDSFYVIGSHGHPRKQDPDASPDKIKARIAASSQVVRIRLKPGVTNPAGPDDIRDIVPSPRLREVIAAEPALRSFLDQPLDENGVTIEGVAVIGERLFAGFRGPSLANGRAPVLSVSLDALFAGGAPHPKLHLLPVGEGRGIRDLAPFDNGLLVLAGPTGGGAGPYDIYWWDAASDNVRHLAGITQATGAHEDRKPEALLPLDQGPLGLRVLVLFDGEKEGAPREIVIPGH
jgi:hypothetical protein